MRHKMQPMQFSPLGHKAESKGRDYTNGYKNFTFLYMPQEVETISPPLESQLGHVTNFGPLVISKQDTGRVLRDT